MSVPQIVAFVLKEERIGVHRRTKVIFGKTMMWALELLQLVKRHISGWSDIEQWRNQACSYSHYQVTLVWRHQSVSQQKNLLNWKFLKFHNNLIQRFRVNLKTSLGLAMPNQYSQTVRKQISSWFWGDNLGQNPQTFMIPIYIVLLYCMIKKVKSTQKQLYSSCKKECGQVWQP